MNARIDAIARSGPPSPMAQRAVAHPAARGLGAAAVALLCVFAQAQTPTADLVVRDATRLLHHDDPVVRGEAALVVARGATPDVQQVLLALARDPADAARHRALIALGLAGGPAAVQVLDAALGEGAGRGRDDAIAAAFGLGLVADGSAATAVARVLASASQGSWKRQRDVLLALLLAMTKQPPPHETVALRQLLDDDSNRDPEVRALLLTLLLGSDQGLDARLQRKLLGRGSEAERIALLQGLRGPGLADDAETRELVERLARSDADAEVRAAALAALTRANQPAALELAVRAMRQAPPHECAQALRTLLQLGGAGMLRAVAPRLVDEPDAARKAALLRAYDAPPPPALAADCARVAGDGNQPWPLRTAAVLLLARSDRDRAGPLLRDTFRSTSDLGALPELARALQAGGDAPVPLAKLCDDPDELGHQEPRWRALLAADHPEAQRRVLQALGPDARPAATRAALQVFRATRVVPLGPMRDAALPALLRALLGDPGR